VLMKPMFTSLKVRFALAGLVSKIVRSGDYSGKPLPAARSVPRQMRPAAARAASPSPADRSSSRTATARQRAWSIPRRLRSRRPGQFESSTSGRIPLLVGAARHAKLVADPCEIDRIIWSAGNRCRKAAAAASRSRAHTSILAAVRCGQRHRQRRATLVILHDPVGRNEVVIGRDRGFNRIGPSPAVIRDERSGGLSRRAIAPYNAAGFGDERAHDLAGHL
jgi:hypothetical protein